LCAMLIKNVAIVAAANIKLLNNRS